MKKFFNIKNKCGMDLTDTEELFHDLGRFAQKNLGFKKPPSLFLVSDGDNASKPLGKTAYYDPQSMAVTIYTDNRHTKDILRSLAHELVHHTQNENGMLNDSGFHGEGYAQKNKDLRQSEKEAYLKGNMCFRDWEDGLKESKPTIYNEWRIKTMSTKKWKNNELMENLSEKFGFKMNLGLLKEEKEEPSPRLADKVSAKLKDDGVKKTGKNEDEIIGKIRSALEEMGRFKRGLMMDDDFISDVLSGLEKEETNENKKTDKYDDNPALKGGQKNLPDALQKGIISAQKEEMNETKLRGIIHKLILSEMKRK